jgi:hypothetical protein
MVFVTIIVKPKYVSAPGCPCIKTVCSVMPLEHVIAVESVQELE